MNEAMSKEKRNDEEEIVASFMEFILYSQFSAAKKSNKKVTK